MPFLCVIGARADDEKLEVLAIEMGDRERKELWEELFQDLARRGLQMEGVELGVMDGLPGLEAAARQAFRALQARWKKTYLSAVAVIARDLDNLLRFYRFEEKYWPSLRTTNTIERVNKEFKRRTKAMEITGSETSTYRLLAYVALTMNFSWRKYSLSALRHFYTLKAA